jgi:hypothetical protein
MASPSQLSGWAGRVLESLDETGISTGRVVSWFQNNLYKVNNALSTGFYTEGGYILPDMTSNESGIYEQMYICDYYSKKANSALGAFAYDWTEIRGEDQGSIRRVSRNEVAKTYQAQAKECKVDLNELITWYQDQGRTLVSQILLNDRGAIADGGLMDYCQPPTHLYHNSTIWI